jgi:hypothetical protein
MLFKNPDRIPAQADAHVAALPSGDQLVNRGGRDFKPCRRLVHIHFVALPFSYFLSHSRETRYASLSETGFS